MSSGTDAFVRPYRPGDRDALYDICARTADNGGDSRHLVPDLELAGNIFAVPYAVLEPDLAFVVDSGEGVVGYVLGTADTATFVRRFRREWLPTLVEQYPDPSGEWESLGELYVTLMHTPERLILPELADYPAHLHIDLLPGHQRLGYGRELMHTFLDALHAQGVARVHIGVLTSNTPARAFYDRLGFHKLDIPHPGVTYLGRETRW